MQSYASIFTKMTGFSYREAIAPVARFVSDIECRLSCNVVSVCPVILVKIEDPNPRANESDNVK
jgi:hypothetical protein